MLEIRKEFKFQLGGSVFYASEGDCIKVKLKTGEVIVGELTEVGSDVDCFDLNTEDNAENGAATIDCEDVIDIMPM